MTPSSEEKKISVLLQSFPTFQMDEDKRNEIARQIRKEKELLARMKRRKTYRQVIGGAAASIAFLLIAYQSQWFSPSISPSAPGVQGEKAMNNRNTNAVGHQEKTENVSTIDRQIQSFVDQAINKTQSAYTPENITVIVADPNTGEILGMGNRSKDGLADSGTAYAVKALPNPVIAFPIVTLAAAIEEGKFNPKEIYHSGTYTATSEEPVKDHNNGRGWGQITYLEGIQRSSNVAFAILGAERLKRDLLQQYFARFGFGQKTGIELLNEETGKIPEMNTPREVAIAAFGPSGSASAIQQVAAIGAIANGGELLKPHMVKKAGSDAVNDYKVRRVVSEETAKQVREILESVVNSRSGAGKAFFLEKYSVAGKPGVTQMHDHQGKVMEGKYAVSFVGFAPSDDPKLLIYVAIDSPKTEFPDASKRREIAAPLFKEVMGNSMEYLQRR